jgi:hypothetical protein
MMQGSLLALYYSVVALNTDRLNTQIETFSPGLLPQNFEGGLKVF